MTACHCSRLSLPGDLAVFRFDEQAVAQNARVRDAAVEAAEVRDDTIECADDVAFGCDVGRIGFGAHAERAAGVADYAQAGGVQVDQREVGAAGREPLRHRRAEAAPGTGD